MDPDIKYFDSFNKAEASTKIGPNFRNRFGLEKFCKVRKVRQGKVARS